MKTREQKQQDLEALTGQFQAATAGMLVGFKKLTVAKDQELRRQLRDAGASYTVVKNTLARKAAEGTPFEQAVEHFKGVTAIALSEGNDPVGLSKAISKFAKDNPEVFTFKAGIVEGKVVAIRDVEAIATLAAEGGADLEGHVPHQLPGAAAGDGALGGAAQPRRRRQADRRAEEAAKPLNDFGFAILDFGLKELVAPLVAPIGDPKSEIRNFLGPDAVKTGGAVCQTGFRLGRFSSLAMQPGAEVSRGFSRLANQQRRNTTPEKP